MALCPIDGCGYPEGTACTLMGCPGRMSTQLSNPEHETRGDSAEPFRAPVSERLSFHTQEVPHG